jgi:hypothetical protein
LKTFLILPRYCFRGFFMLKSFLLIGIFLWSSFSFGQKLSTKEIDAQGINIIELTADTVFAIKVLSSSTNKITLTTAIEGETYENILVTTSHTNGILKIGTAYTPYFQPRNDKLTAHKVIAIEMTLIIPENLVVSVKSAIATVYGSGSFEQFNVALSAGSCFLTEFRGNARLQTKEGAIEVEALTKVSGSAVSKYGTVVNELPKRKRFHIEAESLYGVVKLLRTR